MLPRWQDVLALALRAHAASPAKVAVGWDIAITDAGPVPVEGNGSPCVDLIQRDQRTPLGSERFGELFVWHVERALASRDGTESSIAPSVET